jgi:hypothetical protein
MNTRDRHKVKSTAWSLPSLSAAVFATLACAQPVQGQPPPALYRDFPVVSADVFSPGIPAYARLELLIPNFDVPNDRFWAAIVFYRDPDCIPPGFDLGQFFDFPSAAGPGAFGCSLRVEGQEIWQNGPPPGPGQPGDPAPIYVRTRNAVPNLPIWFVAWGELKPLLDRGHIYIGEVAGMRSLIKGSASWFEEALYPNGSATLPGITMHAEGRLETGGNFTLDWHFVADGPEEVSIRLELGRRPRPLCDQWPYPCK